MNIKDHLFFVVPIFLITVITIAVLLVAHNNSKTYYLNRNESDQRIDNIERYQYNLIEHHTELNEQRLDLEELINEQRTELKELIYDIRKELRRDIASLRSDVRSLQFRHDFKKEDLK